MSIERVFLANDICGVSCGILFNVVLLILIHTTSPVDLKSYKRLLVLHSVTDLMYSVINGLNSLRIIYIGKQIFVVSCGLLAHWFTYGPQIGFCIFTFAFFSELTYVPIDYYYRYMLVCRNNEFTNLRFALCILIAASVTGAYTLLSLRATMFTPLLETKQYEQAVLDALDLGNKLPPFGVINPDSPKMELMMADGTLTALAVYSIIGLTTYSIHKKLAQNAKEQKRGESRHVKQITLLMVVQAILPFCSLAFPILIVSIFTIFDWSAHIIGYFITMSVPWTPAFKPLITMYIIRPYRRAIKRRLCGENSLSSGEVSVTVYETRQKTRKSFSNKNPLRSKSLN